MTCVDSPGVSKPMPSQRFQSNSTISVPSAKLSWQWFGKGQYEEQKGGPGALAIFDALSCCFLCVACLCRMLWFNRHVVVVVLVLVLVLVPVVLVVVDSCSCGGGSDGSDVSLFPKLSSSFSRFFAKRGLEGKTYYVCFTCWMLA